jgi:hypothetical protein
MNKIKNHPWTIAIVAALLGPVFTLIVDIFKKIPYLTTFRNICKLIINFLNFDLKVWWIIISGFIISIVIMLIYRKRDSDNLPDFINYTEDSFKRWRWQWEWNFNENKGKWQVLNLRPYCPNCSTRLDYYDDSYVISASAKCPRCEAYYSSRDTGFEYKNDIELLIIDKIEKGL